MQQVPVDFMHCVLLGVMSLMLSLWFNSKHHNEIFYIDSHRKQIVDKKFKEMKTYSECTRKSESILSHNTFKANELFNFMFYYSKYCLLGVLDSNYYNHFMVLVNAMETLFSNKFTFEELDIIELKLLKFVEDFEVLYGEKHMYFNVHLLTHITETARLFGPLFTTSLFPFENMNGVLANFLNGPKGPALQVCIKNYMFFSMYYKKCKLTPKALQYCKETIKKSSKKYKYSNTNRRYNFYDLPEVIENNYNDNKRFKSFSKYYIQSIIISTNSYSMENKNYNDSFIYYNSKFFRVEKILENLESSNSHTNLYIIQREVFVNMFDSIPNYYEIYHYGPVNLMKIDKPLKKCIYYVSNNTECLVIIHNLLIID